MSVYYNGVQGPRNTFQHFLYTYFFNSAGKKIVGPITKGAEVLPFVSNFLKFVLNSQSGPLNLLSKNCKIKVRNEKLTLKKIRVYIFL